jgi:hypothetical protein
MQIEPVANFSASSLLGYNVQQSPSSEANRCAASQEIPRILWNRKVHYPNKTKEMNIQRKVNHMYLEYQCCFYMFRRCMSAIFRQPNDLVRMLCSIHTISSGSCGLPEDGAHTALKHVGTTLIF